MKWLKRLLIALLLGALVVAALFFYFIYTPTAPKPQLDGEFKQDTLLIDSQSRSFSWYKPKALASNAPLIFVLHGSTGAGQQVRSSVAYEFDTLAEQYGFVVVYPDGYKNHWNDCRASADYSANTEDIDDIAFFKAMIDFFAEHEAINRQQVFVTGVSNGGHMAYALALETPSLFAAFAPMAANLPVDSNLDCEKSGQPVSIAIFNGTNDPVNPYGGGLVELFGNSSRGEVRSAMETVDYWCELAGITDAASEKRFPEVDGLQSTSVLEQRWTGADGTQVRLYTLKGSGHVIPSKRVAAPRILGGGAGDISGPEEIIEFFLFP